MFVERTIYLISEVKHTLQLFSSYSIESILEMNKKSDSHLNNTKS